MTELKYTVIPSLTRDLIDYVKYEFPALHRKSGLAGMTNSFIGLMMLEKTFENQRQYASQDGPEHPFENAQICLDFIKTVIVIGNRFRGRLGFFFRRPRIAQSVINFNNHCTHDYNIGTFFTKSRLFHLQHSSTPFIPVQTGIRIQQECAALLALCALDTQSSLV